MARAPLQDRIMLLAAKWHADRLCAAFFAACEDTTARQSVLLGNLIERNAQSAYGKDHDFSRIRDYADFVRRVPVQSYDDIRPYIERVKRGETRALFGSGQKILMFAMTSGTSDKPKYIPVTTHFLNDFRRGWNVFGVKALLDHPGSFLRPIVQVTSPMDESHSESGIPCGAITGLMARTQKRLVRKYYVAPRSVAYITNATARYYTVMRLAVPRDVAFLTTASPATVLKLVRLADKHRENIVRDVRDGTLSGDFDVPDVIRRQIGKRMKPEPKTAKRLEKLIHEHGALLPKHYWKLGFLANWTGGTMGLYLQDYPHFFGDVPVRDIGLLASEGRMSVPIEDHTPAGILDVTTNFYEFIPAPEIESARPVVLRPHELEVGREYFILLTNSAGLYRYNIGDLIRVAGFYRQAPLIEFLNKGAHIASMSGEKLTEQQIVRAIESICDREHVSIDNFVMAPQWDRPPYYALYLEPNGKPSWQERGLADVMEEELCRRNCEYGSKRRSGRLGPVRLVSLPVGTLQHNDNILRSRFRKHTNEQYKHQFLYTQPGQDATLRELAAAAEMSPTAGPTAL